MKYGFFIRKGVFMEAMLNDAISTINGYLWSYFIIFILIGAGLFFTMTTNFVQIRMIKEMIRLVINGAGSSTEKNTAMCILC